jgi:HD-like signal output (HDOD) protein
MSATGIEPAIEVLPDTRALPQPTTSGPWDDLLDLGSESTLTAELGTLLGQQDPSIREVAEVVQLDPALTLKVIRLANAPQFRGRYEIVSAHEAVCRLGVDLVRTVAAMSALGIDGQLPGSYWSETVFTACAATVAARRLRVPEGDALSAGLLCDIGRALLWRRHRNRYATIVERAVAVGDLLMAEQGSFGANHSALGAMALARLEMPARLVEAVHQHHDGVAAAAPLSRACQLGAMACDQHRRRTAVRRRPSTRPGTHGVDGGFDAADAAGEEPMSEVELEAAALADETERLSDTTDSVMHAFGVTPA